MEREERDKLRDINTKMASLYTPEALARTATAAEIKELLLDVQRDECLSGVAIGSTDRATVGGRTVATVGGAGEAAADLNELLRQLEAQRAGVFAKTAPSSQSPCGIEVSPGREAHEDSRSDLDAATIMFGGCSTDSHPKPPPEACKDTPAPISSVASVPKVGVGSSLPDQRGAEEDENTATVEKMSGAGDGSNVVRRGASRHVSSSAPAIGEGAQYKEAAHRWKSLAERPCSHTSAAAKGTKSEGRREASQMNASAPARPRSQGRAGVGGGAAGTVDRAALAMRDRRQTALASIGVGTLGHGAQRLELTGSKTRISVASGSPAMLPGSRPSSSSVSRS